MELKVGDVIELKKGMDVYGHIPRNFNRSSLMTASSITRGYLSVGVVYNRNTNITGSVEDIKSAIKSNFNRSGFNIGDSKIDEFLKDNIVPLKDEQLLVKEGEYLVIDTRFGGGSGGGNYYGGGGGSSDDYPSGHKVYCQALKDGKYDRNGVRVSFYQSGCFTCMITDIKPVRTLKKELRFE